MRIRKIVVGLAAVVAVGAVAACSAANASTASNHQQIAAATSTVDTPAAVPATTAAAPTKAAPAATKAPAARPPAAVQPAAPAAAPAQAPGVPCEAAARVCVDLAARKAWLVDNGQVTYGPVSIMPGRPGFRTPTGTFHVISKVAHYWSHAFNAPMPLAVFFYPGVAFHIGSLGVPSHGCIHLSPSSASTFFHTLAIGDEVQVLQG